MVKKRKLMDPSLTTIIEFLSIKQVKDFIMGFYVLIDEELKTTILDESHKMHIDMTQMY